MAIGSVVSARHAITTSTQTHRLLNAKTCVAIRHSGVTGDPRARNGEGADPRDENERANTDSYRLNFWPLPFFLSYNRLLCFPRPVGFAPAALCFDMFVCACVRACVRVEHSPTSLPSNSLVAFLEIYFLLVGYELSLSSFLGR